MKMSDGFELVHIADEHMAVPVGEKADKVKGLVVLSPAASFLLENMKEDKTVDELVTLLTGEYNVDREKAHADIEEMVGSLRTVGLIVG